MDVLYGGYNFGEMEAVIGRGGCGPGLLFQSARGGAWMLGLRSSTLPRHLPLLLIYGSREGACNARLTVLIIIMDSLFDVRVWGFVWIPGLRYSTSIRNSLEGVWNLGSGYLVLWGFIFFWSAWGGL